MPKKFLVIMTYVLDAEEVDELPTTVDSLEYQLREGFVSLGNGSVFDSRMADFCVISVGVIDS